MPESPDEPARPRAVPGGDASAPRALPPVAEPPVAEPPVVPPTETGTGFSDAEKLIGAAAAYKAPLASSLAASYLLSKESDPEKRRQLERFRKLSLGWLAAGVVVAIVGLIVIVSFASSHGLGGGDSGCKGGIDTMDPMNTTYMSDDKNHWTATYPCIDGGHTTVPVPAASVPGGGDFS